MHEHGRSQNGDFLSNNVREMGRLGVRSTVHGADWLVASGGTKQSKPEEEKDKTKQMSLDKHKAVDKSTNAYNQCIEYSMWAIFRLLVTVWCLSCNKCLEVAHLSALVDKRRKGLKHLFKIFQSGGIG